MSSTNDGGSAFPLCRTEPDGRHDVIHQGMLLRDYFAGQALAGMLAYSHVNPSSGNYHENCISEAVGSAAYFYADALLAERKKQ